MDLKDRIKKLLKDQPLAVLATSINDKPHTTLIAQLTNIKNNELIFATTIKSRKAQNIKKNPSVSIFVDNRSNTYLDFKDAVGVTIKGKVKTTKNQYKKIFLKKHPYLQDFVKSPSTSLFKLEIEKIEAVVNFQEVYVVNFNE